MAGLLTPPNMGIYNVSKHAVVSLTETLYQDLSLVTDQVGASVLCPYFVPTGISQSHRNRPADLAGRKPTQEPAHRPGHERQGGGQRQGDGGRGGAKGVRRRRRRPVLHLQPPQGAGRDSPDVSALTDPERDVLELWQAAESAAITAAFGPHRYLDEAWFEIRL
jgi:NAD(P)-dependent dehydrogenase (short-subunit alcohol dehydrogenase family)